LPRICRLICLIRSRSRWMPSEPTARKSIPVLSDETLVAAYLASGEAATVETLVRRHLGPPTRPMAGRGCKILPGLANPLPGMRARPLPEGEVTPGSRTKKETRDVLISPPHGAEGNNALLSNRRNEPCVGRHTPTCRPPPGRYRVRPPPLRGRGDGTCC
jgi:hypothetical protein